MLLLLLINSHFQTVNAQPSSAPSNPPSVLLCACSPTVFFFKLDFFNFCPPANITEGAGTGILQSLCEIDVGSGASSIPDRVDSISIREFSSDLLVGLKNVNLPGPFFNGDTFVYTSIVASDANRSSIPGLLQMTAEGFDENDDVVELQWAVQYTNLCDVLPFSPGNSFGWAILEDIGPPREALCGITAEPTPSPSTKPSFQPSDMPSNNPTRPPGSPTSSPSKEPTPTPSLPPPRTPNPVMSMDYSWIDFNLEDMLNGANFMGVDLLASKPGHGIGMNIPPKSMPKPKPPGSSNGHKRHDEGKMKQMDKKGVTKKDSKKASEKGGKVPPERKRVPAKNNNKMATQNMNEKMKTETKNKKKCEGGMMSNRKSKITRPGDDFNRHETSECDESTKQHTMKKPHDNSKMGAFKSNVFPKKNSNGAMSAEKMTNKNNHRKKTNIQWRNMPKKGQKHMTKKTKKNKMRKPNRKMSSEERKFADKRNLMTALFPFYQLPNIWTKSLRILN